MFDPIVIRSKFGDAVQVSILDNGVGFSVAKRQPISIQKPTIEQLRKEFPNVSEKELQAIADAKETKAINIEARKPNLSTKFEPSFAMAWEEWEKLAEILKTIKP